MHNVREYIVECRKRGVTDSVILGNLKQSNWPEDVLEMALTEANNIVPEVVEEVVDEPKISIQTNQKTEQTATQNVTQVEQKKDIFVQEAQKQVLEKKKFSIMAIIALILSPIPFVGLGFAMTTLDTIKRKNMSGKFLAIIAFIIAITTIGVIIYVLFQIFTLDIDKLTGFAKFVNEKYGLV